MEMENLNFGGRHSGKSWETIQQLTAKLNESTKQLNEANQTIDVLVKALQYSAKRIKRLNFITIFNTVANVFAIITILYLMFKK